MVAGVTLLAAPEMLRAHLRFRPMISTADRFAADLTALQLRHPDADVVISGLARDGRSLLVSVGTSLGGDEAIAASLSFSHDAFVSLAAYSPHYVAQPSGGAAVSAAALREHCSGSPEIPADELLRFAHLEPHR